MLAVRRVLVAEDDAEIRQALADMLEYSGYETRAVANGAEALALLAFWRPDAIVLDMRMPEMDGPTFLDRLHARPGDAAIPIVLLSALRDLEARAAGLPVAVVVAKPFDVDDLLSALESAWGD
jgi:two-component system response regulator MprA